MSRTWSSRRQPFWMDGEVGQRTAQEQRLCCEGIEKATGRDETSHSRGTHILLRRVEVQIEVLRANGDEEAEQGHEGRDKREPHVTHARCTSAAHVKVLDCTRRCRAFNGYRGLMVSTDRSPITPLLYFTLATSGG